MFNADIKDGWSHPEKDLHQNTIATFNVLEAMRATLTGDTALLQKHFSTQLSGSDAKWVLRLQPLDDRGVLGGDVGSLADFSVEVVEAQAGRGGVGRGCAVLEPLDLGAECELPRTGAHGFECVAAIVVVGLARGDV